MNAFEKEAYPEMLQKFFAYPPQKTTHIFQQKTKKLKLYQGSKHITGPIKKQNTCQSKVQKQP